MPFYSRDHDWPKQLERNIASGIFIARVSRPCQANSRFVFLAEFFSPVIKFSWRRNQIRNESGYCLQCCLESVRKTQQWAMNVKMWIGGPPRDDLKIVFLRCKQRSERRRSFKDDFAIELLELGKVPIKLNYVAKSLLRVDQNCFAGNVGVAEPRFL